MLRLSDISHSYYPYIVILDDVNIEERYLLLMSRLMKEIAQISMPNGVIDVYKVDVTPNHPPTLYLVESSNIDRSTLEALFDTLVPLLNQAASDLPLCPLANTEKITSNCSL